MIVDVRRAKPGRYRVRTGIIIIVAICQEKKGRWMDRFPSYMKQRQIKNPIQLLDECPIHVDFYLPSI